MSAESHWLIRCSFTFSSNVLHLAAIFVYSFHHSEHLSFFALYSFSLSYVFHYTSCSFTLSITLSLFLFRSKFFLFFVLCSFLQPFVLSFISHPFLFAPYFSSLSFLISESYLQSQGMPHRPHINSESCSLANSEYPAYSSLPPVSFSLSLSAALSLSVSPYLCFSLSLCHSLNSSLSPSLCFSLSLCLSL